MNWKPLFAGLLAAGLLSGCASNVNAPATLPAVDPQPVVETSVPTSVTVNSGFRRSASTVPSTGACGAKSPPIASTKIRMVSS